MSHGGMKPEHAPAFVKGAPAVTFLTFLPFDALQHEECRQHGSCSGEEGTPAAKRNFSSQLHPRVVHVSLLEKSLQTAAASYE